MTKYILAVLVVLSACNKDSVLEEEAVDMTPIKAEGEIIFLSRRIANTGDWGLVAMNADGTNQRLISNKILPCAPPVASSVSKKILFVAAENQEAHLFIVDSDGQNLKSLANANSIALPSWSNDGQKVVFVRRDSQGGTQTIWTVNADGTNEQKLTSFSSCCPTFTPDDQSIIFHGGHTATSGVYKMNTDGSNIVLLTPSNLSFAQPKISPDGKKIAMVSVVYSGEQIYVMNADGSNLKQMTFTESSRSFPGPGGDVRDGNNSPTWSPDSKRLAYVSYENGSPDIFIINADGTGNKRLTDTPKRDEHPTWTPDGKYIIFSSGRGGANAEIFIMKPEGQLQTYLTTYFGDDIYPSFISR